MKFLRLTGEKEFKKHIVDVLSKAQDSVLWVTGLYQSFYNDKEIRNSIKSCIDRVNTFKVLVAGKDKERAKEDAKWLLGLEHKYPETLNIRFIEEPVRHFFIIDYKHMRLEEPHPPNSVKQTKNLVILDAPYLLIRSLTTKFNELWRNSQQLK